MSDNQLNAANQDKSNSDKSVNLQKRIRQLKAHQAREVKYYERSMYAWIGYFFAGLTLWYVMHWHFNTLWSNDVDVLDEHRRFKDIWNVAMYVVPYCFWGMAGKHFVISVISYAEYYLTQFRVNRLKKRISNENAGLSHHRPAD